MPERRSDSLTSGRQRSRSLSCRCTALRPASDQERLRSKLAAGVQVEHLLDALLTGQDEDTPATWFWLTMPAEERQEKLAELVDWVETVFRVQYPGYLTDQIRPCWPNQPEARWELAWLYQLWSQAYLAEQAAPKDAANWHDRWTPGVIHRLSRLMRGCDEGCERQTDAES
jgi:hypothetical protein